ncbi:MAG TPA: T9SS type A sorting domain-containing protein [Flavobacteriales bacterium]|nr:T9SS type A sorting domain-containing protein [Flavobacteriales bacterium]
MKLFIAALAFLLSVCLYGQEWTYDTHFFTDTYSSIEEYSLLELPLGWDDPEEEFPIPFNMLLWGDTVETIYTGITGNFLIGVDMNTKSGNPHLIAPIFSDISDVYGVDSSIYDVSEIRHTVEGQYPNRVFKIEYVDVGFYNEIFADFSSSAINRATFQVWLHETGEISFRYGPNTVVDFELVSPWNFFSGAGLIGNFDFTTEQGDIISADGEADNPVFIAGYDYNLQTFFSENQGWIESWPSNGTVYQFLPIHPFGNIQDIFSENIKLYPNPASNNLTIDLGDLTGVNTSIKLYDSSSKLVFEKLSSATLLIDVSVFAKGLYTLELSTSDKVLRSQVVLE